MVFGARPPLNVLAPSISMASVQNSQRFQKTKWLQCKIHNVFRKQNGFSAKFTTFSENKWLQCKIHNVFRKQIGRLENLNILQLQDARKTHFPTFSMIWATFCTHLNHCYLYVLFISQPQSTNFE